MPVKPIQEESSPESSSESSSSGSDSETEGDIPTVASGKLPLKSAQTHHVSPSPSPPPSKLPTFLPQTTTGDNDDIVQEQMMKDKFRKFWMASIADGFRDDLEEIRKVCYLCYQDMMFVNTSVNTRNPTLAHRAFRC